MPLNEITHSVGVSLCRVPCLIWTDLKQKLISHNAANTGNLGFQHPSWIWTDLFELRPEHCPPDATLWRTARRRRWHINFALVLFLSFQSAVPRCTSSDCQHAARWHRANDTAGPGLYQGHTSNDVWRAAVDMTKAAS